MTDKPGVDLDCGKSDDKEQAAWPENSLNIQNARLKAEIQTEVDRRGLANPVAER